MVKISEDFESIAHEIKVLKLVKHKITDVEKRFLFPSIKAYGTFVGKNVHPADMGGMSENK